MFQHVALRALYTQLTDFVAAQKNRWTVETLAELRARWYSFKLFLGMNSLASSILLLASLSRHK